MTFVGLSQRPATQSVARRVVVSSYPSKRQGCFDSRLSNHYHLNARRSFTLLPRNTRLTIRSEPIARKKRQNTTLHANASASTTPTTGVRDRINAFLNKPRTVPVPRWISPRHYTTTLSEVFGHSSFLLVFIAYAVDDYTQLRIIAVAGCSANLVFTYFHPHGRVLWLPFKWNLAFVAVNSYRLGKVYFDRYRAERMSQQMRQIHDEHFYVMDTVDFARLLRLGETETYKKGDVIVAQGDLNRYLRLVISGELDILRDGELTYKLHEGNFVSEVGLHAGLLLRGKVESCCSIVVHSDTVKVVRWDRTELMHLLDIDTSIRRALKAVLSWDIVSKLKSQRIILGSGEIQDPEKWTKLRRDQGQHRYKAILRNVLSEPENLGKRKEEVKQYRHIHQIDDAAHEAALQELGWTAEEYSAGARKDGKVTSNEDDNDDDDGEEQVARGLRWYIKELYLRFLD